MKEIKADEWGRVILDPASVFELLYTGHNLKHIDVQDDPLIDEYNGWCDHFDKPEFKIETVGQMTVSPEDEHAERAATWLIGDDLRRVNVREFLLTLCVTDAQRERVNEEMDLFEARQLEPLLQLMIFLVDHFRRNNIVWGVGRGSSVASYVLFMIGVHKVDAMRYGLSIHEFLK